MHIFKIALLVMAAAGLTACNSVETATRNTPYETVPTQVAAVAPSFKLAEVSVSVPRTLRVSEANSFYPAGDIVWRGDPPGDRYAQIEAVFQQSLDRVAPKVQGAIPVRLEVELRQFHALTEKTRYTVGGVHSIRFVVTLRDARSGQVLRGPREIEADLEGFGGAKALAAEAQGRTQKVRITEHLARVFYDELTQAQGYALNGRIVREIRPI